MVKNCDTCRWDDGILCCEPEYVMTGKLTCSGDGLDKWEPKEKSDHYKHAYELLETTSATLKERGKDRDNGEERSMAKTVELFNKLEGVELTETQGWRFMVLLKLVRQVNSNGKCEDSFIDAIGYTALMVESALKTLNEPK